MTKIAPISPTASHRSRTRRASLSLVVGALLAIVLGARPVEAEEFVVLTGVENPVETLTIHDVRRMFRGDMKRWPDGERVVVLLPARGSKALDRVARNVLQLSSVAELSQFYMAAIFRQQIVEPPPTATTDQAIEILKARSRALTVAPLSAVEGREDVRRIRVEGL